MKKIILLIFFVAIFFYFANPAEAAVCCDKGCYTLANICCGNPGQKVGVEGCPADVNKDGKIDQSEHFCPKRYYSNPDDAPVLGQCLTCDDNNQWQPDTVGIPNCNACPETNDAQGNPTGSACDVRCPEGFDVCISGCCPIDNPNDPDGDGLTNAEEKLKGTNPNKADTDGDGFSDGEEIEKGTNPLDKNSKPAATAQDSDGDGLTDAEEADLGTLPNKADSDGDGFSDGEEVEKGTDPLDFTSNPATQPGGVPVCNDNGQCEDDESCKCDDCEKGDQAGCLPGLICSEEREVCSGNLDGDDYLNDDDNCVEISNNNQEDEDEDCYLADGKRSPLYGYCGDACEGEFGLCESVYGDKQCCDSIPGAKGSGQFYGFTQDCPTVTNGVGCWSSCFNTDADGNVIKYESGACIDGKKIIKELKCNPEGENCVEQNRIEESCFGIPLVPFFTWINLLITAGILFAYYSFRKN